MFLLPLVIHNEQNPLNGKGLGFEVLFDTLATRIGCCLFWYLGVQDSEKNMSHTYQIQEDIILRQYLPKDFLENATGFRPVETDTFIVGYPRAGSTWISYILYLLKNGGEPIGFGERLWEDVPEVGVGRHVQQTFGNYFVHLADLASHPRVLRTHLPSQRAPIHPKSKIIYISRNPFDTAVSLYLETKTISEFSGTFDDFFTFFLHGQTDYNDYFHHHTGWARRNAGEVILWITYEELMQYPRTVIKKLGDYMGGIYERNANDDFIVKEVIRHSSLSEMKSLEHVLVQRNPNRVNGFSFFQAGSVGEYKDFFTKEQIERLSERCVKELVGTPFTNTWRKFGLPKVNGFHENDKNNNIIHK